MSEAEPNLWRLTLTAKTGPDAGKTCVVERDVVTVGKMSDCDLVLTDSTVSRRHLRIARTKDASTGEAGWILTDLGSTNGTFLGDTRVQEAPVTEGAVLKAGTVELAFTPERQAFVVPAWPEARFGPLIGKSLKMRELFGMIARIAPTEATVLIQGDTGTGKGMVAKAIHHASGRADKAYMVVDCGAVQRQLIESELFGHEKGAFTGAYQRRQGAFELASGGTIFIDELGELELDLQPKLLRVLDAREVKRIGATTPTSVDLRVIAASRRSLLREVERGAFREDLYFRLSVVTLAIPALKDRAEDIPLLVEHFLEEVCKTRGITPPRISSTTMDRLTSHDWPGNVRELKNAIERAILLSAVKAGDRLEIGALASNATKADAVVGPTSSEGFDPGMSFSESKERWVDTRERAYVSWLLGSHEGNVSAAARAAQMDRKYLHKLMKKYGLET